MDQASISQIPIYSPEKYAKYTCTCSPDKRESDAGRHLAIFPKDKRISESKFMMVYGLDYNYTKKELATLFGFLDVKFDSFGIRDTCPLHCGIILKLKPDDTYISKVWSMDGRLHRMRKLFVEEMFLLDVDTIPSDDPLSCSPCCKNKDKDYCFLENAEKRQEWQGRRLPF